MYARLSEYWSRWLDRRIPRNDRARLSQRNLFILPTSAGVVFGLLLLITLITGINYQNSLILLLTFFLGAVFVAAMHQTHSNLSGVEFTLVSAGEGFAGEAIPFVVRATSPDHEAIALTLVAADGSPVTASIKAGEYQDVTLLRSARQRGYVSLGDVRVETRFPFGLLKAWSWVRPGTLGIVYPKPIAPPYAPVALEGGTEDSQALVSLGQDHAELRPWREGDMSQRVLWKRFARTGDMVIADWQGEAGNPEWFDYDAYPGADRELRLSYLAAAITERAGANPPVPYGLRLPGLDIAPDSGKLHEAVCLRALATFGLTPGERV
ncbi:MAG: DUF58 domain-containing protein [Marinobacter sp.]|nr:DUF58 domain-containing protein [Marinobacter sp.]